MLRHIAVVLYLLLLAACVTNSGTPEPTIPAKLRPAPAELPLAMVLCATFDAAGYGSQVRVRVGPYGTMTILSGETICRRYNVITGGVGLAAQSNGGGLTGPLQATAVMRNDANGKCQWWLIQGPIQANARGLVPCSWMRRQTPRAE